ncbi:uncharacterized protein LOC120919056 [Rana temporaria]|uniref:uncharacterized protein LOC120919056 n=1 Tax=Rana temporaria TaxID=8407 RepID=UPI001AAC6061|nr:uncharacterized protein LOC120919056 [Rana temporaria]
MFCCSSCCAQGSAEETAPLSTEVRHPRQVKVLEKGEKLLVKLVGVPEYDEKFSEIAELYNQQVEQHNTMNRCLAQLNVGGSRNLGSCIETLKTQYSSYDPKIKMEGYNFSLTTQTTDNLPGALQESQEVVTQLSRAVKLLMSTQTKLGGMVFSVPQDKSEMESRIKEVNTGYLDQIRLVENLQENTRNMDKAKKLSKEYEEEARSLLTEIANISGISL